jgi:CheY-like chemotaxis protein
MSALILVFSVVAVIAIIFIVIFSIIKSKGKNVVSYDNSVVNSNNNFGRKLNILLIDDNDLNNKVTTRILNKYNVSVDVVTVFEDGLSKINSGIKYDLVLLDYLIPMHNARDMLNSIKRINSNLSVIALSTVNNKDEVMYLGFNDFLLKPINDSEVERILNNIK